MKKDAVLFSYDTLDANTVTDLVLHYSAPLDENGKTIMVLNIEQFCSKILGIDDQLKIQRLRILASRSEPDYKRHSEDKANAFQEQLFWNCLYYFKWNRLKCSIKNFHIAKASIISFPSLNPK